MGLSVPLTIWQQFTDKVFENISKWEMYKAIMDDAMILSTHKQHFEILAYLFQALITFG